MSQSIKKIIKIVIGFAFTVLIISSIAAVYAIPLTDQIRDRDRDQLQLQDCIQEGTLIIEEKQYEDQSCPYFIDEDGDGICDNCPKEGEIICPQHQYRNQNMYRLNN